MADQDARVELQNETGITKNMPLLEQGLHEEDKLTVLQENGIEVGIVDGLELDNGVEESEVEFSSSWETSQVTIDDVTLEYKNDNAENTGFWWTLPILERLVDTADRNRSSNITESDCIAPVITEDENFERPPSVQEIKDRVTGHFRIHFSNMFIIGCIWMILLALKEYLLEEIIQMGSVLLVLCTIMLGFDYVDENETSESRQTRVASEDQAAHEENSDTQAEESSEEPDEKPSMCRRR